MGSDQMMNRGSSNTSEVREIGSPGEYTRIVAEYESPSIVELGELAKLTTKSIDTSFSP